LMRPLLALLIAFAVLALAVTFVRQAFGGPTLLQDHIASACLSYLIGAGCGHAVNRMARTRPARKPA
jgi:TRAP-type C4-dicarboxylate transport system permease small subunit